MKKLTMKVLRNCVAIKNQEYPTFISMQDEFLNCTDIIFDKEGTLKEICSEKSKEEVKRQLLEIVDKYFKEYK